MHKLDPAVGERIIGRINGESDGPLVLAIGGMHGNEPSGVEALNQVIKYLKDQNAPFRGDFVAFSGNIEALRSGQRFIHRDLNRIWILDNGSKQ
ncbi:MAG: succinylglutamate desuccinylase/aspartoacylase family protein [Bacteroidetes bacterium]|nr:succinylglutamate desuccinylase/aspartoacylase family protein [Bacteroidota bacterium]